MWALRRASLHLKNRGLSSRTSQIYCVKLEIACYYLENYISGIIESQGKVMDALLYSRRFYNAYSSSKSYVEVHNFPSLAGAKRCREKDNALEDGFSVRKTPHDAVQETTSGDEMDDESISESELSVMTKAILSAPTSLASRVLDKWVEAGNEVTQTGVSSAMLYLRKRQMFVKALQLSEWLESKKYLEFGESEYASRVDLIAKVRGIFKAEEYIQQIPESFRGEIVYRTLLANFVIVKNTKKSEELFNKMKNLFPITCFACNQLLLLYKRTNSNKIAAVLLLMEKENIKPSLFTYQVLIDVKRQHNDISGMEQIIENMNSEGVEPSMQIQASLARSYVAGGLKDKAEAVLKEMEGGDIMKNRRACQFLLPIYASLGREDEVERLWRVCASNPGLADCMAAIDAWGQLKRIEDAEAVFEKLLKIVERPSSKHYAVLLNIYATHRMLAKGKNLIRRMADSSITITPPAWDALVRLYARAGEVEKAESILEKALKQKKGKPPFTSYLEILDQYADRGDIHNAEKIFLTMRRAGFLGTRPYRSLLYAYINAKAPAYGIYDRMKADDIIPNKALTGLLAQVDAFRKSTVAEMLE